MPRIFIPEINDKDEDVRIGLWKMTDEPSSLFVSCPMLNNCRQELASYKSETKRKEYLSVRALLYDMEGTVPEIRHNEDGKPSLAAGGNISISHTNGYAAVILSERCNVAIDIEYMSDRVGRIAKRFLRADEKAVTVVEMLLAWCGKETLYKLHSQDKLSFHDMRVESATPISVETPFRGTFYIENLKRGTRVLLYYLVTDMFVMTYAVEKNN